MAPVRGARMRAAVTLAPFALGCSLAAHSRAAFAPRELTRALSWSRERQRFEQLELPRRGRGPAFVCRRRSASRVRARRLALSAGSWAVRGVHVRAHLFWNPFSATLTRPRCAVTACDAVYHSLPPQRDPRLALGTVRSSRASAADSLPATALLITRLYTRRHVRTRLAPSVAGHAALARLVLFPVVLAFVRVIITTATADLHLVRHHETRTSASDHVQPTVATAVQRRDEEERPTDAPLISVHEPAALPRRPSRRLCHHRRIDTYTPHAPLGQVGGNV